MSYTVSVRAVFKEKTMEITRFCSGVIISPEYVLTAAHCLTRKQKEGDMLTSVIVIAGTNNYNTNPGIFFSVSKIYMPTYYHFDEKGGFEIGDIAVLKMRESFDVKRYKMVDVPDKNKQFDDVIAKASGYGWNVLQEKGEGSSDGQLRYIDSKVMNVDFCGITTNYKTFVDEDIYLCARAIRFNTQATSMGDSGGPLVYTENGKKYVIGIISMTSNVYNEKKGLTIYTKVTSYSEMIEKIKQNKIDNTIKYTPIPICVPRHMMRRNQGAQ